MVNRLHTLAVERAGLPRVMLAQRVVDAIVHGALTYATETGEALIGLPVPVANRREPDLYVLDTIAPDASAVRSTVYFEQGDYLQGDTINWLFDNWDDARKLPNAGIAPHWNVPLGHLGDWHKHPGTLTEPSWGDTHTAIDSIFDKDTDQPYLLAILATVWNRKQVHTSDGTVLATGEEPIIVDVPTDASLSVRLDSWYISRRTRRFVHLTPVVRPNDTLPTLPIIGWHLRTPDRLRYELDTLSKAGYAMSPPEELDADHTPPRELCFTLARRNSERILIAVTQADYPRTRPELRTVPMQILKTAPEGADLFPALWAASQPLPAGEYPAWEWNAERTLCELAQAVEGQTTP
ncbi:MAG: MPN domain-containing protein [Aggregatilineales bacterium]